MKKAKSKTNKRRSNQKRNIIIASCIAALALVLIIVGVVVNWPKPLGDSFFISDGSKYVLSLGMGDIEYDNNVEYIPIKTHLVYFYSGENITGLKIYYEYKDDEEASTAYNQISLEDDIYNEVYRDGKYVILVANKTEYEEIKASDIKKQIDFMDTLNRTRNTESD